MNDKRTKSIAITGRADPWYTEQPYSDDESEFLRAIDRYKARTGRQFPAWSEALAVLKSLGYHK